MPRLRALRIVAAIGLVVMGLSVVVPAAFAAEETTTVPATPVCLSGASYDSSTGVCERPATLECTAGLTPSGDQCVAPSWCPAGSTAPDRGTCTDASPQPPNPGIKLCTVGPGVPPKPPGRGQSRETDDGNDWNR